jgi:hypothetical protein
MALLCPFAFPAGSWARPAWQRSSSVVLFVPAGASLPVGFAPWLLASGGSLVASAPLSGGVAVCLSAPPWLRSALLAAVRPPRSAGSRTQGVLLPW